MSEPKKQKKRTASADQDADDYAIKPEKGMPSIDTSDWPLLLKVNLPAPPRPSPKTRSFPARTLTIGY